MESFTHAQTIKAGFANEKMHLERSFSFRNNFADQWFDLHHAQATASPYSVTFDLRREDFPASLKDIKITNLSLLVDLNVEDEKDKIGHDVSLRRGSKIPNATEIEASAGTTNTYGLISTRIGKAGNSAYNLYNGNGSNWSSYKVSPIDTWTLTIPQNTPLAQHFANEKVNDLVFIVEFEGQAPEFLKLT